MKGHSLPRAVLACIIVLLSVYTFAILNSYPSSLPNRLTVERFSQDWIKEMPRHPLVRHVLHSKIANRTRAWIRDSFPHYNSHLDSAKRFFRGSAVDDSVVQQKRNYSSIFSFSQRDCDLRFGKGAYRFVKLNTGVFGCEKLAEAHLPKETKTERKKERKFGTQNRKKKTGMIDTNSKVFSPKLTGDSSTGELTDHSFICKINPNSSQVRSGNFCGGINVTLFSRWLNNDVCKILDAERVAPNNLSESLQSFKAVLRQEAIANGLPKNDAGWDLPKQWYENSPLRVTFEPFLDLPRGLQDSGGAIVDDYMISTGGFCGGNYLDSWKEPYCCGDRGFLTSTYALDMRGVAEFDQKTAAANSTECLKAELPMLEWQTIPAWPGLARQGHMCTAVPGNTMYCWGGFSYKPASTSLSKEQLRNTMKENPYGYRDGYRLTRTLRNGWKWDSLPSIPHYQGSFTSLCYSEAANAIYLVGGADYDSRQFMTVTERAGMPVRVGALAWKFSIRTQNWTGLPDLPGTARMNHALVCVGNKVYVIGGATGGTSKVGGDTSFFTVVDNWALSVHTNHWSRLKDTPYVTGNFGNSVVYKSRYIFLVGGAGYGKVMERELNGTFWEDGKNKPPHMKFPSSSLNYRKQYSNSMLVYDIQAGNFFFTDPLPLNINMPLVYIFGDSIYVLGGEGGSGCAFGKLYGQHLELVLRGRISLTQS